ncbi:type III secretion protein Q [Pseudomonas flavescens]|uniref:Type III secretion protein Q n=1 Tax=Phytopseudomonas flavescens TaxID=29435 RepID=A0A1G8DKE2_9GAMM|nr:FliM/FliN family flagellar motor switch protein [Pseudomonas flavescens]SDH58132.1 type III secretion protein Q [Pseudomonas flavescens]
MTSDTPAADLEMPYADEAPAHPQDAPASEPGVDESLQAPDPEDELDPPAQPQAEADEDRHPSLQPLSRLPLALTLRCGSLRLSLEQLQRLDSGAVLEVQGVTPGQAWLYNGEQPVAEGELVDVGGRLGLQITRMASLT